MKIHNLGNDYAYQQRLKKVEHSQHSSLTDKLEAHIIKNVIHQVQTGGEAEMATISNDSKTEEQTVYSKTKKSPRKKKEEGANNN